MENQETTFPQLTPKDFTDGTAYRVNSLIRDLYEKVSSADGKAESAMSEAKKVAAVAADERSFLPPVQPPSDPSNVVLTVSDYGDNFGLVGTWDAPVDTSTTTGYEWAAQYYSDSGGTVPVSDFIQLGAMYEATTLTAEAGPWPRPTGTGQYARIAVRGVGSDNSVGNWVWSSAQLVSAIPGSGGAIAPTQPGSSDWALPTPSTGASDYRADKVGNQFVRLRPSLVTMPADAGFVEFWLYKAATGPTENSLWEYIGTAQANGEECENWQPQPTAGETWIIAATASKFTCRVLPKTGVSNTKTAAIDAWTLVKQLLTCTLTLEPFDYYGTGRYRIKVEWTRDTSDNNFQAARAAMNWCDATFTPLAGSGGVFKDVVGSYTSPMWIGSETGFDLPSPADGTQYRQVMVYPIGHDNVPNLTAPFVFNTTLSPDGGFNAAAIDPTTLGPGLIVDGGALKTTARGLLLNADLEYWTSTTQPKDWDVEGTAGKVTRESTTKYSGTYAAKISADGTGNNAIAQLFAVRPGQVLRLSSWLYNNTGGSISNAAVLNWFDSSSAYLSGTSSGSLGAGSWIELTMVATAPANAAYVRVYPVVVYSSIGSGEVYVDQVTLTAVEPLTGTDLERVNGILGLSGGSLSQEAKYGSNAKPVIIGSGAPSNSDGRVDGSYYIDAASNSKIYKKKSGAWTSIEVGDIVAGNFIGFTLTLNLNSVTTTINNASDASVPGGTIYPGIKVTNNSSGEYAFVSHGSIGVNLAGNSKYSIISRTQMFLAYNSSGTGYPRVVVDNSSDSGCGLSVYAPGTGAASTLCAVVGGYPTYGYIYLYGTGAGISIGGYPVLTTRQSAPTAAGSSSTYTLPSSASYTGLSATATYTSYEQGIINQLISSVVYLLDWGNDIKTQYNSLLAAYNSLLSKLNTSGHGLVG